MRERCETSGSRRIWLVGLCCLFATISVASAQLQFSLNGEVKSIKAVQLWYNGYWKHPGWINGTLVSSTVDNKIGRIVVVEDVAAPYDKYIREQIDAGAKAIVFLRDRSGVPGQTMYLVTGSDQKDLVVPVVEIFQIKTGNSEPLSKIVSNGEIEVSIWPQENEWKVANEKTAFQVVLNVLHSFMALAVMLIGAWRLSEWWGPEDRSWLGIGPVCLILEIIGASLRLAYSIVDPVWTFRILPDSASFLLTFNLPFSFSSGILLTFFWAETLKASRVRASPFISEYRKTAIGICILLFIAEIITDATRIVVPVTGSFNPSYISQVLYVITAIVLTVCYIICAHKIQQKLKTLSGKKRTVRNMTLRFVGSTAGYVAFAILTALLIFFINIPWGFKIILNMIIFVSNSWSLLQVYSFTAPHKRNHTSSAGSAGYSVPLSPRNPDGRKPRTNYSRTVMVNSQHASMPPLHNDYSDDADTNEKDIETTSSSSIEGHEPDSKELEAKKYLNPSRHPATALPHHLLRQIHEQSSGELMTNSDGGTMTTVTRTSSSSAGTPSTAVLLNSSVELSTPISKEDRSGSTTSSHHL
jgi:hypothetical protein